MRKELSKVDIKMSVKFLYPHLNRGDLYTKQGILCMLQSGIKVGLFRLLYYVMKVYGKCLFQVEPLLLKDWSAIMDWSPHVEHKGEYLAVWNAHHLDKAVCSACSHAICKPRLPGGAKSSVHQRVPSSTRTQHEVLGGRNSRDCQKHNPTLFGHSGEMCRFE